MKTQWPHCKAGFKVSADYRGQRVKCLKCNAAFVVEEYTSKLVSTEETTPRKDTVHQAKDGRPVSQHSTEKIKRILKLKKHPAQPPNKEKIGVGFSCLIQIAVDSFLLRRVILP
ncbi:MAG: hypothetical protein J7M40_05170, partial [Planctomycetes bacterium]|nr:hypothetical protein [Planctomycetota bacterium]